MVAERAPIRAPEFPADVTWVQGGPLKMNGLRGRPVLIDFWDYTCINCIRTLPYLREWHARYSPLGLVIVGVHAPEFAFAQERGNVARAIEEFGLEYPIVLDNNYSIWDAYSNRYWPAKYLIDKDGYLRGRHFGEGAYGEVEAIIQTLLREANPRLELPPMMEPVRPEDRPGAVCYRVTPELYLGYRRGRLGNTQLAMDRPASYQDVGHHAEGHAYLVGEWLLGPESISRPLGAQGESRLNGRYMSKEVNLVMRPREGVTARVELLQDGRPLPREDAGEDVRFEGGRSFAIVDEARMYRLVDNREIGTYELGMITRDDGLSMYAFTFVGCVTEG